MRMRMETNKTYCNCKKCGARVEVDTSTVYTSLPPMYMYHCDNCKTTDYVCCSDCYGIYCVENKNPMEVLKSKEQIQIEKLQDEVEELMDRVRRLENDR
jgi:hypothetical protein